MKSLVLCMSFSLEQNKTYILQGRFSDLDQVCEQIKIIQNIQIIQLSIGTLQCEVAIVAFDTIQLIFSKSSCPLYVVSGQPSDHFIPFTCVLEPGGSDLIYHHRRISCDTLLSIEPDQEIRMVVPAQMQLVNLQIRRDVMQDYWQLMEWPGSNELFLPAHYMHVPVALPSIRAYLNQLLKRIRQQPDWLQSVHFKQQVVDDLVPLLINAIASDRQTVFPPPPLLSRSKLVQQAEDYMMAHLDQPLTLKDLCIALHTSDRPLFHGFQTMFGVGPMEYLKIQRLHSVRRALKVADPATTAVKMIAQKFGFWSLGHFARDYKMLFGELPSETLRQSRGSF
jgi:AraC family transcriptional regulator, ethanolamine operon transcriptional activator